MQLTTVAGATPIPACVPNILRHPSGKVPVFTKENVQLVYRVLTPKNESQPQEMCLCVVDLFGTWHVFQFTDATKVDYWWMWKRIGQ